MAGPVDYIPIAVEPGAISAGKTRYAGMGTRAEAGEYGWAGFTAEAALIAAINTGPAGLLARPATIWDYDIDIHRQDHPGAMLRAEVKTRVIPEGWHDPARFDWITVPTHAGREPIKAAADLVIFCWYPLDMDCLWVVGYVRGAEEFRRRAVFYHENEPLPRGGWAKAGGAYCIDIKDLRPMPRNMLREYK